eukprot:scaffold312327_cov32-Tisochrysis_lutea.AAC.2
MKEKGVVVNNTKTPSGHCRLIRYQESWPLVWICAVTTAVRLPCMQNKTLGVSRGLLQPTLPWPGIREGRGPLVGSAPSRTEPMARAALSRQHQTAETDAGKSCLALAGYSVAAPL